MSSDDRAPSWDEWAATFDDEPDHGLRDPRVRTAWRRLLGAVLPAPPVEIVDLGCGTGSLAVLLAEEGHTVTGIDRSAPMIAAARRKAEAADVVVTFRRGDAAAPEVPDGSVDVVLARHVVWALPEPGPAIRRWARLLRPGGSMVLVEGRWATGAGLTAKELAVLIEPVADELEVLPLRDETLWGRTIDDERYLIVARPSAPARE